MATQAADDDYHDDYDDYHHDAHDDANYHQHHSNDNDSTDVVYLAACRDSGELEPRTGF